MSAVSAIASTLLRPPLMAQRMYPANRSLISQLCETLVGAGNLHHARAKARLNRSICSLIFKAVPRLHETSESPTNKKVPFAPTKRLREKSQSFKRGHNGPLRTKTDRNRCDDQNYGSEHRSHEQYIHRSSSFRLAEL
jgi:hypothetical protein